MPPLKVAPLAFESLGARSSALSVETDDLKIVVDPAVSLAPKRFGLPPHTVEEEAGVSVGLAAEFLDVKPSLLEARRKKLFGKAEI